jgi:rhodanese-related sulfurtransferase
MTRAVAPADLKRMLRDGAELALLDVREEGRFAAGHLLLAVPLPLSRLELRIRDLLPRLATRTVLLDDGDGLAARAAARLAAWGYAHVAVLEGGNPAWRAAGYELFSGMNVPSKAFGEFVEHRYGTPSLTPQELHALMQSGRPLVILDSRPMEEFSVMNIPGALDVPGAELVHRVHDLAPDAETLVVVNCAGRTRSIIGAQSLINAGIPNRVVALRNGTMGWHLAGLELERGQRRGPPALSAQGLARARAAAQAVARRFGVRTVDAATLARWRGEAAQRTLYVLDVRLPEEYEAGHLAGSRNAPGGQLVQATDASMATRHARVVLVDDTGVRATLTASWLIQMGWAETFVLEGGLAGAELVSGPHRPDVPGLDGAAPPGLALEPAALAARMEQGGALALLDLARSADYARGHIPGAWFAIRAELAAAWRQAGAPAAVALTSPDGLLARLAVDDARAAGAAEVLVLRGGTAAWRAAGRPLATGAERMASEALDVFPKPYERPQGVEEAMREYLRWEVALVQQLEADGDLAFQVYP